jgi:hypothetical protein
MERLHGVVTFFVSFSWVCYVNYMAGEEVQDEVDATTLCSLLLTSNYHPPRGKGVHSFILDF